MRCGLRPTSSDQQADGGHEVVVVEEGLAHAHEDQIDAVAADLDAVAVEDGDDLAGDLAGGEVALQAELGGEAELAVDGAADLAGDADGGALAFRPFLFGGFEFGWGAAFFHPASGELGTGESRFVRLVALGFVAGFAFVPFGHPDGFYGLLAGAGALDQVALGAVYGLEDLDDLGRPTCQPSAARRRRRPRALPALAFFFGGWRSWW